jgi:hypothetical protein
VHARYATVRSPPMIKPLRVQGVDANRQTVPTLLQATDEQPPRLTSWLIPNLYIRWISLYAPNIPVFVYKCSGFRNNFFLQVSKKYLILFSLPTITKMFSPCFDKLNSEWLKGVSNMLGIFTQITFLVQILQKAFMWHILLSRNARLITFSHVWKERFKCGHSYHQATYL